MDKVERVLTNFSQKKGWKITIPKDGWEKGSFIATLNDEQYFVKFGINPGVMVRLSDLKVTAEVLNVGNIEGENYMIQKIIMGTYIPKEWLGNNLKKLAEFIARYQNDYELKQILINTATNEYLSIEGELEAQLAQLNLYSKSEDYSELRTGIKEMKSRYKKFINIKLVPVHDDPNTKNIFLSGEKILMVDWNKIRLSDPLSDIGAILWWYVPSDNWKTFLSAYGLDLTDQILERIYLAAAKMSMGFTLWFLINNKDYKTGFKDFTAAISRRANPRAWYLK